MGTCENLLDTRLSARSARLLISKECIEAARTGQSESRIRSPVSIKYEGKFIDSRGPWVSQGRTYGLARVEALIRQVRFDLFPYYRFSHTNMRRAVVRNLSEVRSGVVDKLLSALNETEDLAKKSGRRVTRGAGGVSSKARWYHLMAYIAQTLDLVLRSAELDEINERLSETEKTIDELQRTTSKTG